MNYLKAVLIGFSYIFFAIINIALFGFLPNYVAFSLIASLSFLALSITLCCLKKHVAFKTKKQNEGYILAIIGGFCISLISLIVSIIN